MKVYYHATLLHLLKDYYYRIAMSYLLAKLSQCILNSTNGLVVNEVYVLQNGKCTIFANDSGKQSTHRLLYTQNTNIACAKVHQRLISEHVKYSFPKTFYIIFILFFQKHL